MPKHRLSTVALALVATMTLGASHAQARPIGNFGSSCIACHGTTPGALIINGREVPDVLIDVLSDTFAEIPTGAFGDPDRGEGPLATYTATPGGSFELLLSIKDPGAQFSVSKWSTELKRIYHTDPDFQAGNPDKLTWRNDQLTLIGAQAEGNGSTSIPLDETDWTLHTDTSLWVPGHQDEQYYTSSDTSGHGWSGPLSLSLTVAVPNGVLPGWYDIEAAVAGMDSTFLGFYDDEHFYLNVVPEPAAATLGVMALGLLYGRRRRRRLG